jgi:hypothetical protein
VRCKQERKERAPGTPVEGQHKERVPGMSAVEAAYTRAQEPGN